MDYARKIGKERAPKRFQRSPTTMVTTSDSPLLTIKEPITEDRRLKNWKKWLADRRKVAQRIKSITGREQTDQLINSCEGVRPYVEMKNLMEYASIPVPVIPDKYRGGPEFWKLPDALPNHGDPCLPEITLAPTRKDLNLLPDLLYVDVPLPIEYEKNLQGISKKVARWEQSSYLKQREEELQEEIKLLLPKKPETKEMIILGKSFEQVKKPLRIPVISISEPDEVDSIDDSDLVMILRIQEREIVWKRSLFMSDEADEKPIEWSLKFRGIVDQRSEETIIFENRGNTAIHYHWRDQNFRSKFMTFQRHISPFYFNKTDGIILQGQIVELKVWYLPRSSSVFTESWRLYTDPKLCHSPLIFRFWGCAEDTDDECSYIPSVSIIDQYLDRCIRDSVIREIIKTIMDSFDHKKPPEPAYGSLFLESEVFLAKNPDHHYHPDLMLELHKLYCDVVERPTPAWSLSLYDLREVLFMIENPQRGREMLRRFTDLYYKCLRPTPNPTFVVDQKHATVYNLLCCFMNSFEVESEFAMSNSMIKADRPWLFELEMSTSTISSARSDGKRFRKGKKRGEQSSSLGIAESSRSLAEEESDDRPYREAFFVRIHELLGETIERISAAIDSLNRLAGTDK